MSNTAIVSEHQQHLTSSLLTFCTQGQLYKRIVDTVVEASRADFEENGVNVDTIKTFQDVGLHLLFDSVAPAVMFASHSAFMLSNVPTQWKEQ